MANAVCTKAFCGPNIPLEKEPFGGHLFERIHQQVPETIITINAESKKELTIGEIQKRSIQLAVALRKYLRQGDVLASLCENDNLSIFPIISSLYLATTISLINPISNARELKLNFDKTRPKIVFCTRDALPAALEVKEHVDSIKLLVVLCDEGDFGVSTLSEFVASAGITDEETRSFKPANPKSEDDAAIVLCSSGTSGVPKGVTITYGNLIATLPYVTDRNYIGLSTKETSLLLIPMFHVFGLYMTIFSVMEGVKIVLVNKFNPSAFLEALAEHKVTKMTIVPPLAIFLAKSPLVDDYDLSNLQDILCGAAPLSQNVIDMLHQRLKVTVRQLYGLTEVGLATCVPPDENQKPNSSGKVTPNLEIAIKDIETRTVLSSNREGEICMKGPVVMKGYIGDTEATDKAFDDEGYFLTGDVGYFDEAGCLFIVDRIKELIKFKGFQVAPAELEGILLTHPAVKEAAVVGVPNERAGEVPTAFVVRQADANVTDEELIKYVADRVSVYKQLSGGVKFVKEIPKNAAGKIVKRLLRENIVAG